MFICTFSNFNLQLVQSLLEAFAYPCLWSGNTSLQKNCNKVFYSYFSHFRKFFFFERVILQCQYCSMTMELVTGSDYLDIIKYRTFKIPSKKMLPSLFSILEHKSDFVQLMHKILLLVHKIKHSWPPCCFDYFSLLHCDIQYCWLLEPFFLVHRVYKIQQEESKIEHI